jgi:hypothetical protein
MHVLNKINLMCRAGTRAGNNGVYARSEAELEQIMDGLHEQEVSEDSEIHMKIDSKI